MIYAIVSLCIDFGIFAITTILIKLGGVDNIKGGHREAEAHQWRMALAEHDSGKEYLDRKGTIDVEGVKIIRPKYVEALAQWVSENTRNDAYHPFTTSEEYVSIDGISIKKYIVKTWIG